MRVALLVVGIVVGVGALGATGYAYFTASSAQAAWNFFCSPGSFFNGTYDQTICATFLATAERYNQVALWAGLIALVGLAVTIAGAALKGPPEMPAPAPPMYAPTPVPPPVPPAWQKTCAQCGRQNPSENRFCAGCGAALP